MRNALEPLIRRDDLLYSFCLERLSPYAPRGAWNYPAAFEGVDESSSSHQSNPERPLLHRK
jgi:hypothetical protein